jgi:hypothetical protein
VDLNTRPSGGWMIAGTMWVFEENVFLVNPKPFMSQETELAIYL